MKNLSTYIKGIPPGKLAELRGMRPNDSTRDKKRLLDFVKKLESDLGGFVVMSKVDYIQGMLKTKYVQFDVYELFAINSNTTLNFQNRKTTEVFHIKCEALLDKILDHLQGKRWSMVTLEYLPIDDIIELIENKEFRV